ncbi:MAG: type II toxin-antitoxin system RelE/ParE family toxin [Blastocatellia bacterium]|nr:type II toxin-antitoxin system RelE/ParE family toxin [Blastocatellia bacterium]
MSYSIIVRPSAIAMLKTISDRRIREKIDEKINGLANEPEKQGKELGGELEGYRTVRAVGQCYRIIYRIDGENVVVVVVALGIRKEGDKKDVYKLAQRLFKLGLLEDEPSALEESSGQEEMANNTVNSEGEESDK